MGYRQRVEAAEEVLIDNPGGSVRQLEIGEYGDELKLLGRLLMLAAGKRIAAKAGDDKAIADAAVALVEAVILDRAESTPHTWWDSLDDRARARDMNLARVGP